MCDKCTVSKFIDTIVCLYVSAFALDASQLMRFQHVSCNTALYYISEGFAQACEYFCEQLKIESLKLKINPSYSASRQQSSSSTFSNIEYTRVVIGIFLRATVTPRRVGCSLLVGVPEACFARNVSALANQEESIVPGQKRVSLPLSSITRSVNFPKRSRTLCRFGGCNKNGGELRGNSGTRFDGWFSGNRCGWERRGFVISVRATWYVGEGLLFLIFVSQVIDV